MPAPDPRTREDYDRLYYRLDLEPGASAAEIKHNYRQLAQIFHPDKWRHPSPASLHWASEQFKKIKEAREVLEEYWSAHDAAPASRVAQSDAQIAQMRRQVHELQLHRERLRGELDALQNARLRGLAEFARMQTERERLIGELVRLREEATHERASAAGRREQEAAQAPGSARAADSAHPANGNGSKGGNAGDGRNGGNHGTDLAPAERHPVRDFFFSRFDDPARGWLMTLSGIVVTGIVLFVVAHKIVFSVFDTAGSWRWLGETLQALLIAAGVVLVGGHAWAQRTFYRADRAGREHGMPLPVHETWLRVSTALRGTGRHGAEWRIESAEHQPGDAGFELRAVLRYSTARPGKGETHQIVTFRCRAHALSAAETRIAWGFGVQAPTWWLLPAARVVRDLRRRIEMDLAARL